MRGEGERGVGGRRRGCRRRGGRRRRQRDANAKPAKISLRKDGRIEFSDSLPSSLHQRLRNIIHTN